MMTFGFVVVGDGARAIEASASPASMSAIIFTPDSSPPSGVHMFCSNQKSPASRMAEHPAEMWI